VGGRKGSPRSGPKRSGRGGGGQGVCWGQPGNRPTACRAPTPQKDGFRHGESFGQGFRPASHQEFTGAPGAKRIAQAGRVLQAWGSHKSGPSHAGHCGRPRRGGCPVTGPRWQRVPASARAALVVEQAIALRPGVMFAWGQARRPPAGSWAACGRRSTRPRFGRCEGVDATRP